MKVNLDSAKSLLKTLFSLSLGLLIFWAMYRNTDIGELWRIIKSANLGVIAASLVFGLIGNAIRGLRWELFVNSLGYHPPRASIMYATLGNYAVNFVLPRAGDIWRCGVVSKYDKVPFSKTLETFLVDKMIDIIAGLIVIFVSVLLYIDFFSSYINDNQSLANGMANLFSSAWMYVGLATVLLIIVLMCTVFRKTSLMMKIRKFFATLKYDLKLISEMKEKKRIIIYTIIIWLCFYLYFYICFYAFDFTKDLGPLAGL
ncbi:MAG: flippase-like domain-containing protein, partial [Proteiniphilum sp.]|nr:flippase-like domain-containing protein [Proteiniphilum sp.]